jgi:hypothetical protein
MFRKRPSEWTAEDVCRMVSEQVQEGSEVEFKGALSTRDGQPHPWATGGKIGEHARNELLEEVVAFANTYGGWLLLGIEETEEKPPRAAEVAPLRACAELAESLRLMCRDCIEPRLPVVDVEGVPMQDDGAGVVVFHAPRSRMAPHRLSATKECYRRHADRTEKMTMREIQDLTLQIERGMAAVERRFQERQELFAKSWGAFADSAPQAFGFRATLVPLEPLYIESVHDNVKILPLSQPFRINQRAGRGSFIIEPYQGGYWRPLVRGTTCINDIGFCVSQRFAFCDGMLEYQILEKPHGEIPAGVDSSVIMATVDSSAIMATVANALVAAERFRKVAGATNTEYALEIEIRKGDGEVPVMGYGERRLLRNDLETTGEIFPRYSVGPREEFTTLWQLVERDFWNAAGLDWGEGTLFPDFERAL